VLKDVILSSFCVCVLCVVLIILLFTMFNVGMIMKDDLCLMMSWQTEKCETADLILFFASYISSCTSKNC